MPSEAPARRAARAAWILLASLGWSAPSLAQTVETLHLRGGGFLRGTVVEWVPGDHVTILLANGQNRNVPWAQVDPDSPPPTAAAAPASSSVRPVPAASQSLAERVEAPAGAAVRPFSEPGGRYARFEVSVVPEDTEIRVRPANEELDSARVCEGHCTVELPADRLWIFSASRGFGGSFLGYGSHEVRTGGGVGTVRRVSIELRHYVWADVARVTGLVGVVTGLVLTAASGCGIFNFEGDCATWNGLYLGGLGVSLLGLIQPSNRSDVDPARTISLTLGPGRLSVGGTF